jgi:hypothetical protein
MLEPTGSSGKRDSVADHAPVPTTSDGDRRAERLGDTPIAGPGQPSLHRLHVVVRVSSWISRLPAYIASIVTSSLRCSRRSPPATSNMRVLPVSNRCGRGTHAWPSPPASQSPPVRQEPRVARPDTGEPPARGRHRSKPPLLPDCPIAISASSALDAISPGAGLG